MFINIDPLFEKKILSGEKTVTVRRNIKKFKKGNCVLILGKNRFAAEIEKIEYRKVAELDDKIVKKEGMKSRKELISILKRYYPDLRESDWVSVIYFNLKRR